MWTCPKCSRVFQKTKQVHSCRTVPLDQHFKNKEKALEIYHALREQVTKRVGACREISLPCCIHWFGHYDFIALLPKKDKLEVRFSLDRKIEDPRIYTTVPLSSDTYKNCLYLQDENDINTDILNWIKESYSFKEKTA